MMQRTNEADLRKKRGLDTGQADLVNTSLVKAAALLDELGRHPEGLTATVLAQASGVARPTVFRLLVTLERIDYVSRRDNRYALGWKLARLGRQADPHEGVSARVQPILDAVAVELNETLGFALVRGEADFDIIAEASGQRMLNAAHEHVGSAPPRHASAMGKLLLAELSDAHVRRIVPERLPVYTERTIATADALIEELRRVREQGYALLDDELESGLFAIGAPVRDRTGALLGMLSISGPTTRLRTDDLDATIGTALRAAVELAAVLALDRPAD